MKKILITIGGCMVLFAGCKEKAPTIDFSLPKLQLDSTYTVSPVPATDPHNVLAEEFTGQTCANCPSAHELLNSLASGGRLNVMGLYIYGLNQTNPAAGALYDFRNAVATEIGAKVYDGGPTSGIPCGGIDRIPVSGALQLYASSWPGAINSRLSIVDSLNLQATSKYNPVDSYATITVFTTYTQRVGTKQNLSIAIVEDSLVDKQETLSGTEEHYLFTNVFRDMVTTSPYGDPILSDSTFKEKGLVNKRIYNYKIPGKWKPEHCRVIAFINYSSSESRKDIIQSVQTKLAP